MKNKSIKWILIIVVIAAAGFILWNYFIDFYRPKAYMVISEFKRGKLNMAQRILSIQTFAMEIDLSEGEVVGRFPIDIKVPTEITLSPSGQELYVAGVEGHPEEVNGDLNPKWTVEHSPEFQDIHVYDLKTKKLKRIIELPNDANGRVGGLKISPDGKKLFISNPYKEEGNAPTKEKRKKNWVLDSQTGEFLFGFDVGYGPYMSKDGGKSYLFSGPKESKILEPGFTAYDIENDTVITAYRDYDRLMKKQGGLHIEGFKFGYPHMEGYQPMIFYERDTYRKIAELDLGQGFETERDLGFSGRIPGSITENKKYRVVSIRAEKDISNEFEYYLRWINIPERKIEDTIKIWEGSGRILGPVVH